MKMHAKLLIMTREKCKESPVLVHPDLGFLGPPSSQQQDDDVDEEQADEDE